MKKPEIVITVEGGVIQDIQIPKNCNARVKVMDFDVEGCEDAEVSKNSKGEEYVESIWEN